MKLKDSDFYKKYAEYSSNPQTKAVISLGFWLLFFIIIIMFARGTNNRKIENNGDFIKTSVNSYEYTYTDDENVIYGKVYGNKHLFNMSNHKYYYDGKDVYELNNFDFNKVLDFDISYLRITPKMINDLTENLNYTMDDDAYVYSVPLTNFMNLFSVDVPVNLDEASKYNIVIKKYYLKDKLCMVKLDLSNYYSYVKKDNRGLLTIDFYEQNKVNDFSLEYDGMIGVIK